MDRTDGLPIPSSLGAEFRLWLWWKAETGSGYYNFRVDDSEGAVEVDTISSVDIWIDERIAMRQPDQVKVTAVLTGENPSAAPESKVALACGKIIAELRLGIRHDDREFLFTLKGPALSLHNARLPQVVSGDGTDAALDRLFLLEELERIIKLLFSDYAHERTHADWTATTAPALLEWVNEH